MIVINDVHYTTIAKQHHCPMWNTEITIYGKYFFFDIEHPSLATYAACSCPILENLNLPKSQQDKTLSKYICCTMQNKCLSSVKFKDKIDINKDGYSQ